MFVYCSDREKGRSIKEDIERDTGVKVKRVIRNIDRVKNETGVGIFVYDDSIDIDYDFKDTDIVVSMEKMNFNDWVDFTENGIDIVDCSEGFGDIAWRLVHEGVRGAKANDRASRAKIEEKKYEIKDYYKKNGGSIVNVVSASRGVGKSTLCINLANKIKKESETTRVIVIDRVKGNTGINYFVNNHPDYEKVDTKNSQMGDNIYRDTVRGVFVLSPSNEDKVYKDVGVSDIVSVIDNMKKHFDVIIIDTDSIIDGDYMSINDICTKTLVVTSNSPEKIQGVDKLMSRYKMERASLVISMIEGCDTDSTHKEIKTDVITIEVPKDVEGTKQKGCGVYIISEESEVYESIKSINIKR